MGARGGRMRKWVIFVYKNRRNKHQEEKRGVWGREPRYP